MSKVNVEAEKKSANDLKPKAAATIDTKALQEENKQLTEALTALKAQMDELKLRHAADQKNLMERSRKEVRDAGQYSVTHFAKDLLSVFDILEESIRSLSQDERVPSSVSEGLQMTLEMLVKTLKEHDIEVINPEGETFDPNRHDAISMEMTDEVPAKTIVRVIQKGYQIKDRLLRPAMVVVAKEKSS